MTTTVNQTSAPDLRPIAQDPELLADFQLEAQEHIQSIEVHLLRLERNSEDREAVHAVFRGFHTIKGLAGFMDFTLIREVAHELETILELARDGQLAITAPLIDMVLAGADAIKRCLLGTEEWDLGRHQGLLARVREMHTGRMPDAAVAAEMPGPPAARPRTPEARSVKVDTQKLDYLVDMVGELVIAESILRQDPQVAGLQGPRLGRNLSQLARITNEVQKTAMAMRMVPVRQLFQRMTRVVRDLSHKTGKPAELHVSGAGTELDRNLVEELADPLLHMLRNAMDHGVETPEERAAAGKGAVARLELRASHQSGSIVIQVSDDGQGLDREKILARGLRHGLLAEGGAYSDSELFQLIFQPGFSTAARISNVSGRGVGMDVVGRQVQKLRGRVEIQSRPGLGATFYLRVPLTLAVVEGLIVGVGGERYILPLFAVREIVRPAADAIFTVQDRGEMALVRNRLLPVVRLHRLFGVTPRSQAAGESVLIVTESPARTYGLLVDELIGKQEVVIKNLGPLLERTPGVAGGAILGDGRVGLILDLDGIFQRGRSGGHAPAAA